MTLAEATEKLTPRQREGRAVNAVAELLRRTLSVPNIYLDPPRSLVAADVLAVDRGGAGDIHAVEINLFDSSEIFQDHSANSLKSNSRDNLHQKSMNMIREKIKAVHQRLMSIPSHFRYLAIPFKSKELVVGELMPLGIFSKDGIGKLGVILISDNDDRPMEATMLITPERFRMLPTKLSAIENKLLAKSRPDIEVRI